MRIKVLISYDGSRFIGSQSQKHSNLIGKISIIDYINKTLKTINIKNKAVFSSRTDKGVHALGQVFHLDLPYFWIDLKKLEATLQKLLLPFIQVKNLKQVGLDFHARFSAKSRVYRYIIYKKYPSVFMVDYVAYYKNIDMKVIQKAINILKGKHNFKYFSKRGDGLNNYNREIYKILFYQYKNFYIFYFRANSFLRSQIRIMVDFLLKISDKKLSLAELALQLERRSIFRKKPAPASGLYLVRVNY